MSPPHDLFAAANEAMTRGQRALAEKLCRQATVDNPDEYWALVLLSHILRENGEIDEASALAEKAAAIQPGLVEAHFQLGLNMLAAGRPQPAAEALRKAVSLRPEVPVFSLNLGIAFEWLGNRQGAKEAYLRAARLAPKSLGARLRLIALLLLDGDIDSASVYADQSLTLAPDSAPTLLLAAEVKLAQDRHGDADRLIKRALELDPNSAIGHCTWGFRELHSGDFEAARESLSRSIELQPNQGLAYMGLTQTRKLSQDDQTLLSRMEQLLASNKVPANESGSLGFAIAKGYDDLGRYKEAMAAFDDAHAREYRYRFGNASFDRESYSQTIDSIIELYTPERLAGLPATGIDSNLPILVVGMLRSGTTLTEQILSSHSEIGAAGENLFWGRLLKSPDDLRELAINGDRLRRTAADYLQVLRAAAPGANRVSDKLPGNYLRLGLIHQALPNAKIIHCRRSPIDTALSIYTTPNRTAPSFSHSKEGIVFTYREYLRLMEHWRSVLPPSRFFEVHYEELVADPEPVIRSLLEFCELDWEDACLRPDLNAKQVATPSLWQVRQPIYRSSVERWRRYEPWLGALRELLPSASS